MNQPLAKQAYGKIIEMILSGALTPGDALQEAKLGDLLDMSRTPVREAIKRIEAEGLATQEGRFLKIHAAEGGGGRGDFLPSSGAGDSLRQTGGDGPAGAWRAGSPDTAFATAWPRRGR